MRFYRRAIGLGIGPLFLVIGKSIFYLKNLEASTFTKLIYLFINLSSLLVFALILKNINYTYGISMMLSSISLTYVGVNPFSKLPDKVLNTIMFSMVLIIGLIMWIRS
ncbi:MAG: hypothetical protein ACMUEM_00665 [Flavobacteriales bacterium AspAUS03]